MQDEAGPARAGRAPWRAAAWWAKRSPAWTRADSALAVALAALVAARWPDRARALQSWDANTFALSLERYDVHALRPHAPGYPVYVALAKGVHTVLPDANEALVALSLLFTAVAAAALYAFGRHLAGRGAALAASVLLLAAPVPYVHSVTANAYPAEMAGSILVAWLCWRARQDPGPARVALLAFAFALAIGVRPSLALYLVPLAAWAVLRPPWTVAAQVRRLGPALLVGAATCLAWFLPMIRLSGGYGEWSQANDLQSGQVVFVYTLFNAGWPAVVDNAQRVALFLRWELRWVVPPLLALLAAGWWARGRRKQAADAAGAGDADHDPQDNMRREAAVEPMPPSRWDAPAAVLGLWLLPALLFFLTVYSGFDKGPSGYMLAILPGMLLAGCAAGAWALRSLRRVDFPAGPAAALGVVLLLVAAGGLVAHRYDVADVRYKDHDAWWSSWSALGETYPPSNTSIVALWSFALAWYGYPEHVVYNYRPPGQGPGAFPPELLIQEARHHEAVPDWYDAVQASQERTPHRLDEGVRHLVLFDFQLAGENGGPRRLLPGVECREDVLPNGWRILVVDTVPERPDLEDYFSPDPAGVPSPEPACRSHAA